MWLKVSEFYWIIELNIAIFEHNSGGYYFCFNAKKLISQYRKYKLMIFGSNNQKFNSSWVESFKNFIY